MELDGPSTKFLSYLDQGLFGHEFNEFGSNNPNLALFVLGP